MKSSFSREYHVKYFLIQDELVKRKRIEIQRVSAAPRTGNRLQMMANQVKEVLPHVPMAAILSDLSKCQSQYVIVTQQWSSMIHVVGRPD